MRGRRVRRRLSRPPTTAYTLSFEQKASHFFANVRRNKNDAADASLVRPPAAIEYLALTLPRRRDIIILPQRFWRKATESVSWLLGKNVVTSFQRRHLSQHLPGCRSGSGWRWSSSRPLARRRCFEDFFSEVGKDRRTMLRPQLAARGAGKAASTTSNPSGSPNRLTSTTRLRGSPIRQSSQSRHAPRSQPLQRHGLSAPAPPIPKETRRSTGRKADPNQEAR